MENFKDFVLRTDPRVAQMVVGTLFSALFSVQRMTHIIDNPMTEDEILDMLASDREERSKDFDQTQKEIDARRSVPVE